MTAAQQKEIALIGLAAGVALYLWLHRGQVIASESAPDLSGPVTPTITVGPSPTVPDFSLPNFVMPAISLTQIMPSNSPVGTGCGCTSAGNVLVNSMNDVYSAILGMYPNAAQNYSDAVNSAMY